MVGRRRTYPGPFYSTAKTAISTAMKTRSAGRFEVSLESANLWFNISNIALLVAAGLVSAATWGVYKTGQIKEKYSDERISANEAETARARAESDVAKSDAAKATEHAAKLAVELEQARNAAKQIDANLLHEQRLTANERWRLERLESIVLPRSIDYNSPGKSERLSSALKEANFPHLCLAIVSDFESISYGLEFKAVLENAGLLVGPVVMLPVDSRAPSFIVVAIDGDRDRLADFLFQKFNMGQGWRANVEKGSDPAKIDPALAGVPTERNCLVIGSNRNAAAQGTKGQAGEGLDEHGRPVPPQ